MPVSNEDLLAAIHRKGLDHAVTVKYEPKVFADPKTMRLAKAYHKAALKLRKHLGLR